MQEVQEVQTLSISMLPQTGAGSFNGIYTFVVKVLNSKRQEQKCHSKIRILTTILDVLIKQSLKFKLTPPTYLGVFVPVSDARAI